MNENPLVTVYIPTYNRLELLKRAVKSVLDQDYSNIELIVVDDGSSDGTVDYLESLSKADRRVRYFVNEVNSGACVSRNKAIWAAKGEFITGLDDDDYFLRKRITEFFDAWDGEEACIALASYAKEVSEKRVKIIRRPAFVNKNMLFIKGGYVGSQVFTKTSNLRRINGFDSSLKILQDLDCWLRMFDIAENSYIKVLRSPSYIIDISHPHERISNNRYEKEKASRDIIAKKHQLPSSLKEYFVMDESDGFCYRSLNSILKMISSYFGLWNLKTSIGVSFRILKITLFYRKG